jgi:hypothetical protein
VLCPFTHSLFADDLILCGKAMVDEAQAIKTILYDFCHKSGQPPNLQKSSIYFSRSASPQNLLMIHSPIAAYRSWDDIYGIG